MLALKVIGVFFDRHGDSFKDWVIRIGAHKALLNAYTGPLRDTKVTIAFNSIFELFVNNESLNKKFMETAGPPFVKDLVTKLFNYLKLLIAWPTQKT